MKKILTVLIALSFVMISCAKKEVKKEQASFKISGMTCEIGCAKTIASKLSKKEGVLDAKVAFKDSIATIAYDANVTNKADLMAFVNGIGNGKTYKTCEKKACDKKACDKVKKACSGKCDENCKKQCSEECKKACAKKTSCKKEDCEKACCSVKPEKKGCAEDCKKACCEA